MYHDLLLTYPSPSDLYILALAAQPREAYLWLKRYKPKHRFIILQFCKLFSFYQKLECHQWKDGGINKKYNESIYQEIPFLTFLREAQNKKLNKVIKTET